MLFSKVAKFQFPSLKLTVVWIVSQYPETAMTVHNALFILSRSLSWATFQNSSFTTTPP
jgi:hypothetical protein